MPFFQRALNLRSSLRRFRMQGTTVTNFGTVDGSPKPMGSCGNYGSNPTWGEGITVAALAFKPTSTSSKIHIQGSPITVGETKNVADDFRVAVSLRAISFVQTAARHESFSYAVCPDVLARNAQ